MIGSKKRGLAALKEGARTVERRRSSADTAADSAIADAKRRLAEHGTPALVRPDVERGSRRVIGEAMMNIGKREQLKSTLSDKQVQHHVKTHGLTGPLPSNLKREVRMQVYEARYRAAGGPKGERWNNRAKAADTVKTAGLAGATAAGAGLLVSRGKKGAKLLAKMPHVTHHAEGAGIAAATVGGAGELGGDYARRRQAKYTSAPAGVAGGALRRMRNYPGGQ